MTQKSLKGCMMIIDALLVVMAVIVTISAPAMGSAWMIPILWILVPLALYFSHRWIKSLPKE